MDPVAHFGMPYRQRERMVKFYSKAFGWKMRKLGKEMGGYVTAATTETDKNNMVKRPGVINGGFFPKKRGPKAQYPSVVIAVDDIGKAMRNVEEAGGKVLGPPAGIPGVGFCVPFTCTEGNRPSTLEPRGMQARF